MTEQQRKQSADYSADSIQVLEGLEAVRKRPAMYIGDISVKGLHHLVYEVVDNSIDEALGGYCKNIEVVINENNSVTVTDDGRGIPVDYHEKEKKSALEVVMTVLHAGGKFNKDTCKVSGGLHGVGVSCVNALSKLLKAEIHRDGKMYVQEYSQGKPLYPVKEVGVSEQNGTIITFIPDDTIFTTTEFHFEILEARLRELAYLNKGIHLSLIDKREHEENGNGNTESAEEKKESVVNQTENHYRSVHFHSDEGLKEFVEYLDESREKLTEKIF